MIWIARLIFWPFCGEWLLLLRCRMAPSLLFLLVGVTLARALVCLAMPLWNLQAWLWLVVLITAVVRWPLSLHLRNRREREHFEVPDFGLPWSAFYTGARPRPSKLGYFVIEPGIAAGITALILSQSTFLTVALRDAPEALYRFMASPSYDRRLRHETPRRPPGDAASSRPPLPVEVPLPLLKTNNPVQTANSSAASACFMLFALNVIKWRRLERASREPHARKPRDSGEDLFPEVRT